MFFLPLMVALGVVFYCLAAINYYFDSNFTAHIWTTRLQYSFNLTALLSKKMLLWYQIHKWWWCSLMDRRACLKGWSSWNLASMHAFQCNWQPVIMFVCSNLKQSTLNLTTLFRFIPAAGFLLRSCPTAPLTSVPGNCYCYCWER